MQHKQSVNIKSPTGCVHRGVTQGYHSCRGSRRTLCNHTTPSHGGLGWNNTSYHDWPETDEEVTCKRCLKEIEPTVTSRRYDLEWMNVDEQSKEVSAVVTINDWFDSRGAVLTMPDRARKFILTAGKYHSGMTALPNEALPAMSERRRQWLQIVVRAYWSAKFNREADYIWDMFEGDWSP